MPGSMETDQSCPQHPPCPLPRPTTAASKQTYMQPLPAAMLLRAPAPAQSLGGRAVGGAGAANSWGPSPYMAVRIRTQLPAAPALPTAGPKTSINTRSAIWQPFPPLHCGVSRQAALTLKHAGPAPPPCISASSCTPWGATRLASAATAPSSCERGWGAAWLPGWIVWGAPNTT